jgi:hypothetical protein
MVETTAPRVLRWAIALCAITLLILVLTATRVSRSDDPPPLPPGMFQAEPPPPADRVR